MTRGGCVPERRARGGDVAALVGPGGPVRSEGEAESMGLGVAYRAAARRRRLAGWWRMRGPNSSERLALVCLDDERPFRAYWPLGLTQLVGGRSWSLALVRYRTALPELVDSEREVGA